MTFIYLLVNSIYICICMFISVKSKRKENLVDLGEMVVSHPTLVTCTVFSALMYGNIIIHAIVKGDTNELIGGSVVCWAISYLIILILVNNAKRKNERSKK